MSIQGDRSVRADLCVVGAGIAGLNAVHVASRYLSNDQHIVLVDRRDRLGGMWVETYDYVRLHQPHQFFTAGNVEWAFDRPPEHLASKDEVLDHFNDCLDEARRRVGITELFGHELETVVEGDDDVVVTVRGADGARVQVIADRFICATGLSIEANQPLALSSDRVRSISPETCDLRSGEIAQDDAPVWVIGSGKTGMDALHTVITHHPGREVNLVAGSGTFFVNRDRFYPTGIRRWYRGARPNALLAGAADRFDGTNELDVFAWCRDTYGIHPTQRADHFFIGLLSEAECERIRAGLSRVVMGHLVDVVDDGEAVELVLRDGTRIDVPPGSWVVNCTSHFDVSGREPEPPYVSAGGRVVTVGASPMFGFSSFASYFLTHLLYLDQISTAPLYAIDGIGLLTKSPPAAVAAALTLAQYNLGVVFDHVPRSVFDECGLDFDRWYPAPRRLVGQLKFVASHKRRREQYRRALDTVTRRFEVAGGPLVGPDAPTPGNLRQVG